MNNIKLFTQFINENLEFDRMQTSRLRGMADNEFSDTLSLLDDKITPNNFKKLKIKIANRVESTLIKKMQSVHGVPYNQLSPGIIASIDNVTYSIKQAENMKELGDLIEYYKYNTGIGSARSPVFMKSLSRLNSIVKQAEQKQMMSRVTTMAIQTIVSMLFSMIIGSALSAIGKKIGFKSIFNIFKRRPK